jgi:Bacterial Ig domain
MYKRWQSILLLCLTCLLCSSTFAQTSVGLGGGGSIYAPAVAPYNANIIFVSCDMTGLYRSTDGGLTWKMMDERSVTGSTAFSVAFDPTTPGHIIANGPGGRLMESFNTGDSWSAFSPGVPNTVVTAAFSSDSPTKLVIGTSGGVYVLQSGAWQAGLSGTSIERVIFVTDPSLGHQVAYAASSGGIWQLNSSGSWQLFSSGLPISGHPVVDIAGGADGTHYAIYATLTMNSGDLASNGGVYRYASNNPTWTRQSSGLNGADGNVQRDPDCDIGTPQYKYLGVAAGNPDTAYVSAINTICKDYVYKGTLSAGQMSWTGAYDGFQNHTTTNLTPGWIEMQPPWGLGWGFGGGANGMVAAPGDVNTVVYVNEAAVHVTTNGAAQWTERYTNLATGTPGTSSARWQTTGLDVTTSWNYYAHPDPNKSNIHFIANTDIALSRSVDSGSTWVPILQGGGSSWNTFYQLAFEYPAGTRIWAGVSNHHDIPQETQLNDNNTPIGNGTVLVSTDDGATWNSVVTSGLPIGPVVSIIYHSGTLYASVWGNGVYSSSDGGSTWTQVGSSASFTNKHVYQLRFDAAGSLYVVVAANNSGTSFVQGGLYKLVSGSWQKLSSGLETLLAQRGASLAPYDFLIDPTNSDLIYLCAGDVPRSNGGFGVYKYSLSANTWSDMGLQNAVGVADSQVAFAPFLINNTFYVTTMGDGIWQTTNGGSTWTEYKGIPFMSPQRMTMVGNQMYITTFGGGVWKPGTSPPPPPPGPTVSMTAPTAGSTVSGSITLTATASDPSGIAGVTFLVDGTATGAEITTAPYSMSFDTTTLSTGNHTFSARARNNNNVTATSSGDTVNVQNTSTGALTLTSGVALSPASPFVNQSTTATFTVQNTGTGAITVQSFVAAGRDPSNANVDFPATAAVTLQPGQSYTYSASRTFTTAGTYSTWPSWWDGTNWHNLAAASNFTVQANSPGQFTVTTAMALSPASPAVNQSDTATFTVTNTGGSAITAQYFLVGARDPSNANVDFPTSATVTLQPGQSYTYTASRTFTTAGTYSAWPSWFDGTNWYQLATPVNFTVTAPALFSDNFNRTTGLGANWSMFAGSYTTNGTQAVSGTMTSSGTGNWAKLVPALGTSNYAVSADIIVPAGSLDSGLVARSNDSVNFDSTLYSAQIATDGHIYLYRRNAWNWTLLSSVATTITAGTSYNLKLITTGSSPVHLEVWLNGVQKIVFDDSSTSHITSGVVGMVNYDTGVKYDNFTVTQQ